MEATVTRPTADAPVVARSDVVVVGGGPAGLAAAVAAARNGASVTLLERYAYLGGLAAGGMVLVLDDFADGATEITVRGIAQEMVERLGLGYERLADLNPGIVYAQGTGFGTEGVYVPEASLGFGTSTPNTHNTLTHERVVPSAAAMGIC
ncbi:MAG: FAD-dependent oxidoreductase [bacterium]|nr:FAD-dependent oxidoreductase [bacterium]